MITEFKIYESLDDDLNQYKEYQKMVNLVYNAKQSVFIVKKDGTIDLKYWREDGPMNKKIIEFIYKKLKKFEYEIYSGSAVLIFNIQPNFFKELEKEYDLLVAANKYNL
jgi:hypothetical protein